MGNSKVSLLAARLGGLRLDEAVGLAQVVVVQLVSKGLVSGLGEHRLFLQDGQDTHGLTRITTSNDEVGNDMNRRCIKICFINNNFVHTKHTYLWS